VKRTLDVGSNVDVHDFFIVPAHNEQASGRTLQAIHESARASASRMKSLVNDASTDGTAEIAQQNNARVVSVNHRQIAATRNSGGLARDRRPILFVDATRGSIRALSTLRCEQ
jgi:glycosyltransferase involved in cell wall biosynthesis